MFDSYNLHSAPQSHYHSHVEKRAPTDESVRLLREMETSAKNEITKAVSVVDNKFNCVIHTMNDHLSGDNLYAVIFTMNGIKHRVDVRCHYGMTKEDQHHEIYKKVSGKIAVELLTGAVFDRT